MLNEDPKTEGLHFIQNKPWLSLLLKGEFNFGGMPCLLKQWIQNFSIGIYSSHPQ